MDAPILTCTGVTQAHWPKLLSCSVTSASEDDVVFLLFFVENNFHSRRHRKVATRHTLPNIQRSLSFRKFSIMEAFLFLSPLSACTGCPSYFSLSAALGGRQQDVDMGRGSACYLWKSEAPVSLNAQSFARCNIRQGQDFCGVKPPAYPATHSPSTRLPRYLPPRDLKGENTLSLRREGDRWCRVQGVVAVRRISCLLLPLVRLACWWDPCGIL